LLSDAKVLSRIEELKAQVLAIETKATEKAVEKLAITKERVLGELAKIGFANMLDYVQPTASGDVVVDLSALDRDKAAAIQEVTIDTYMEGQGDDEKRVVKRTRFKLANKRDALVDLGKHLGLFVELRKNLPAEHGDKTDEQLRNEAAALVQALAELGVNPAALAGIGEPSGGATATPRPH
jgi:phage terminase small subunit